MAMFVNRDRFKQAILTALADKEMVKIMESAMLSSKSINEVIRETGIPHSTVYRKIKWMLEEELLYTHKIDITPDGKKFSLIRSTLRSVNIVYEYGKMRIDVKYNVNVLEKITERLFSFDVD